MLSSLKMLAISLAGATTLHVLPAMADDITYRNERFGTTATFPSEAFPNPLPAPTSGDGFGWVSPEGAEIFIYARRNEGGETPASVTRDRQVDDVTYTKSGNSYAVVSGYRDGQIFYERYIFRDGLIHSVSIRYPEELRSTYDPLVGPVTMTLGVDSTTS